MDGWISSVPQQRIPTNKTHKPHDNNNNQPTKKKTRSVALPLLDHFLDAYRPFECEV